MARPETGGASGPDRFLDFTATLEDDHTVILHITSLGPEGTDYSTITVELEDVLTMSTEPAEPELGPLPPQAN